MGNKTIIKQEMEGKYDRDHKQTSGSRQTFKGKTHIKSKRKIIQSIPKVKPRLQQ